MFYNFPNSTESRLQEIYIYLYITMFLCLFQDTADTKYISLIILKKKLKATNDSEEINRLNKGIKKLKKVT